MFCRSSWEAGWREEGVGGREAGRKTCPRERGRPELTEGREGMGRKGILGESCVEGWGDGKDVSYGEGSA